MSPVSVPLYFSNASSWIDPDSVQKHDAKPRAASSFDASRRRGGGGGGESLNARNTVKVKRGGEGTFVFFLAISFREFGWSSLGVVWQRVCRCRCRWHVYLSAGPGASLFFFGRFFFLTFSPLFSCSGGAPRWFASAVRLLGGCQTVRRPTIQSKEKKKGGVMPWKSARI